MENWQYELDEILNNPPCDDEEVEPVECGCGNTLYVGDEYYEIDGQIWCPECIDDFLSDHKKAVGE